MKSEDHTEPYFEERNLLGVNIFDTTREDLITVLRDKISEGQKNILFGISAAAFGRLKYRPDLYGIYKEIDIPIAEGAGLPLLARIFGVKISGKVGIVNTSYDLLRLANREGYKVMFFGATNQVNQTVVKKVQNEYPDITVCKGIDGYFSEEEIPEIVDTINEEEPDILFIGITYPIKERFSVKYKDELKTKLIVPCGGAFDVIAGEVKKTPEISPYIPTAWLIRFIQEPVRLFKPIIVTVAYLIFNLLPRLIVIHNFIEENPSIAEVLNIEKDEWKPETDPVIPQ